MMAPDSQVVLLLCSHLGLPSGGDAAPLTPREWHALAVKIHASEDKRPAALLGLTTGQLQTRLDASAEEAERLAGLLGPSFSRLDRNSGRWLVQWSMRTKRSRKTKKFTAR